MHFHRNRNKNKFSRQSKKIVSLHDDCIGTGLVSTKVECTCFTSHKYGANIVLSLFPRNENWELVLKTKKNPAIKISAESDTSLYFVKFFQFFLIECRS